MIGNQMLIEFDMWGVILIDLLLCCIQFKEMCYQGVFILSGEDCFLQFLGLFGGMNWGSVLLDLNNSLMFVNDMCLGLVNYMVLCVKVVKDVSGIEMGIVLMEGMLFGVMCECFLLLLGILCQKLLFGIMFVVDLKIGKLVWQVLVGIVEDIGLLGICMYMLILIGMLIFGVLLVMQFGLLFFVGIQDFYLCVFDIVNGKEIWKLCLLVGSQFGLMIYVLLKIGKQYIIINVGGVCQLLDCGDYIIVYVFLDYY